MVTLLYFIYEFITLILNNRNSLFTIPYIKIGCMCVSVYMYVCVDKIFADDFENTNQTI